MDCAIQHSYPSQIATKNETTNEILDLRGIFPEVFYVLQNVMNFSASYVPSVDGTFGVLGEENVWTGLIGMLSRIVCSKNTN